MTVKTAKKSVQTEVPRGKKVKEKKGKEKFYIRA